MDNALAGIVVVLIIAAAAGLAIYRVYLSITENHEKAIETKQQAVVTQDLKQGVEDANKVKQDQSAVDNAIADFERDSK